MPSALLDYAPILSFFRETGVLLDHTCRGPWRLLHSYEKDPPFCYCLCGRVATLVALRKL